jgi:hypothetical protein
MAQVKAGLTAKEAADRAGVSIRQFRRMVASGTVRPIGQRRPGVASLFDSKQVEQVAGGRDYAAALGLVAWNVKTGKIRSGFFAWFRHDAVNDYPGALRVLRQDCPDSPPASFEKLAHDFAEGFAPGALRYCIGLLYLHAYGPAMKRQRLMPTDARRFFIRASASILGESLYMSGEGIAGASPARQSALAVFLYAARTGDYGKMKDIVRRFAPDLIYDDESMASGREFMQWYRGAYGENRRAVKEPKRAAVARLIPSPDNPRRSISRPVIARIACQLKQTLRGSTSKHIHGVELFGAELFAAILDVKRQPIKRIVEPRPPDSDPWDIESFLCDEISRMSYAAPPRRSPPPPDCLPTSIGAIKPESN